MIEKISMPAFMLKQLPEYSGTLPTGVYPGKMWRINVDAYNHGGKEKHSQATAIEGLEGHWMIGAYFPKDEKECILTWLPIEVLPDECKHGDITEHCYNEECQYLSFNPGHIDDEHHSPNCRGALTRRAYDAEAENKKLKEQLRQKDAEISELIHMNREVDKMMDGIFKEAMAGQETLSLWRRLFS